MMQNNLFKRDIVVKETSLLTPSEVVTSAIIYLDGLQMSASNLDTNGAFKKFFYSDVFDSRNATSYKVFSTACDGIIVGARQSFELTEQCLKLDDISDNTDLTFEQDKLISRAALHDVLDIFVKTSTLKNDVILLTGDTATLSFSAVGGIIGGTCRIHLGGAVYDEVDCSVVGTTLTVSPETREEYNGKYAHVSYLYLD